MGVLTVTEEFSSTIAPARLFKALILDGDNLLPKLIPQGIKSIELVEGNGGPGSIKKMTFAEGEHIISLKQRVDELDEKNWTYKYTVIEGDALLDKIQSITYEVKLEAAPDGGTKGTNVSHYNPKPGVEIKEEQVRAGKEKAHAVFKAVEAYLLANHEAYA